MALFGSVAGLACVGSADFESVGPAVVVIGDVGTPFTPVGGGARSPRVLRSGSGARGLEGGHLGLEFLQLLGHFGELIGRVLLGVGSESGVVLAGGGNVVVVVDYKAAD